MKDKFETIYNLQKKNLMYSPWAKETSLLTRVEELKSEVDEALIEVKKEKWDAFKDEMGDVLWDCLGALARAEHDGHFKIEEVFDHIHKKFTERKPFLLEEREVGREEELTIWREAKARQKNGKN